VLLNLAFSSAWVDGRSAGNTCEWWLSTCAAPTGPASWALWRWRLEAAVSSFEFQVAQVFSPVRQCKKVSAMDGSIGVRFVSTDECWSRGSRGSFGTDLHVVKTRRRNDKGTS
jgi:hypothetical protein